MTFRKSGQGTVAVMRHWGQFSRRWGLVGRWGWGEREKRLSRVFSVPIIPTPITLNWQGAIT